MKPTVASGSRASAPSSIPRPARRTGTRQTGPEIPSPAISASGVRTRTPLVGMVRVASATIIRESSFMACLNSGVRVPSSRSVLSLFRDSGPSTRCRFAASNIQRMCLRKRRYTVPQTFCLASRGPHDDLGDLTHLFLTHPARRHRRSTEPYATRHGRRLRVVGYHVLVASDPYLIEQLLQLFAVGIRVPQV